MATLSELLNDPKRQLVIKQRQVAMEFGLEIERFMARSKVKRSELAARLGKSRAWISKFLYGPRNLKLFTAVEIANAIDCDIELHLLPRQVELKMPRIEQFVPQVQAESHELARFGMAVSPAEPTVTAQGTAHTENVRALAA